MSATKGKAGARPSNGTISRTKPKSMNQPVEVLTSSEAAAYLRVAEEDVLRLANLHELPGRQIGGNWRFLKAGLQDWLRTPAQKSGKDALLALAGAWKDDPDIEEIVRQAYRRRGRPTTEPGQ